jgi:hypothetical protein
MTFAPLVGVDMLTDRTVLGVGLLVVSGISLILLVREGLREPPPIPMLLSAPPERSGAAGGMQSIARLVV